jgi:hypothetical protein
MRTLDGFVHCGLTYRINYEVFPDGEVSIYYAEVWSDGRKIQIFISWEEMKYAVDETFYADFLAAVTEER